MTTFIITFNNLPKTSLIMCLQIFMNYLSLTSIILAMNLSEWTVIFVQLNVSSLQLYSAAFFEKTFSFIWTLYNFQNATLIYVLNHFSSLNALPTIIFTLDFRGLHVDISRLCCTVYFKICCLFFYIYSTVHFKIFLW